MLRLTGDDTQFTAQDEVTIIVNPRPHASRVYTLNNDFNQGGLINLTTSTPDQLQLDSTIRSFKFIWVAVSSKGTVVKINTETGADHRRILHFAERSAARSVAHDCGPER